jgi:sugar phosphate isomerase/epimerase
MNRREVLMILGGAAAVLAATEGGAAEEGFDLYAPENLVAWCIVPFDAKNRTPEERAEMLRRLGVRRLAYDWRPEHIPQFDREIDALEKHGIRLEAFWCPVGQEPAKEPHVQAILAVLRRRKVKTQLWVLTGVPEEGLTQEQKVETAARPLRWIAEEAAKIGCTVALYNHGGWFGEPENQVAIIERLKLPNVGIVYNLHHGHHHLDRFPEMLATMKPHLLALCLNGMRPEGPKILPVGQGERDLELLRVIAKSGYRGPIGILDHRSELDAEIALRENLDGLRALREKLR